MARLADNQAPGKEPKDQLRTQIVEAAIGIIADQGLAALSIRDLAQAIGKSTTVIFNLFQTKAGLLAAIAAATLEADRDFHQAFFAQAESLPLDRPVLRGLMVRYVLLRAGQGLPFVRVWEEVLLDPEACAACQDHLQAWAQLRRDTWLALLARSDRLMRLAPVVLEYLLMEGFYASALASRLDYELLLDETVDGLLATAFGEAPPKTPVLDWMTDGLVPPQPPSAHPETAPLKLRLLDIAADQIMEGGIGSVTNRSVTQHAGASTSTILYHFGDMRAFLAQAIWHSVFRAIPAYLDWRRPLDHRRPADLDQWAALMAQTLRHAESGGEAGFYVRYARLIAQICLLARRDPGFIELAALMRGPEGGGTYARRDANWPPSFVLSRQSAAHFAIWIKGRALLESALGQDDPAAEAAALRQAATSLVTQRH